MNLDDMSGIYTEGYDHPPNLFSVRIASYKTVDDRRLACLSMCVARSNSVYFDVLGIIDVDELLIDVRSVHAGMIEFRVEIAGFVAYLRRVSSSDASATPDENTLRNSRRPPPPRKYMYTLWSSPLTGFSTNGFSMT